MMAELPSEVWEDVCQAAAAMTLGGGAGERGRVRGTVWGCDLLGIGGRRILVWVEYCGFYQRDLEMRYDLLDSAY